MNSTPSPLLSSTLITIGVLFVILLGLFSVAMHQPRLEKYLEESVSSFVSPIPLATPNKPIRLMFGGDLMFDRNIRAKMIQNGYDFPLKSLSNTFQQYELVVANLEGPITDNPSRSIGSEPGSTNNFFFTFDPKIIPILRQNNILLVNLGNNHIHNFGDEGIRSTKQKLLAGNVDFFGNTHSEKTPSERTFIKTFGDMRIAFVSDNEFVLDGSSTALEDVKAARQLADLVIVLPHWGIEYETTANQVIQNQAHQLIDAGADLIIGSHPHVIQQHEDYKGKRIYYSLGNFVFDQYFSPETMRGLLVGVTISTDKNVEFDEIPIQLLPTGETKLMAK